MTVLAERIQARLDALKMTARRASLQAGLSPGAVGKMLLGESASPRAKNLQSLATVLGCDPAYLMGNRADPGDITGPVEGDPVLRIGGEARIGAWGDREDFVRSGVLFLPPLVEFDPLMQSAVVLGDRHMDELFAPRTILHIVDGSRAALPLAEGLIVAVGRSRFAGQMWETSIRQVERSGPSVSLTTRYRRSDLNERIEFECAPENVWRGRDAGGEEVVIRGVAVRAYYDLGGPPLFEMDDEDRILEFKSIIKKLPKQG